jgi:drug/metabolite transporter (DMT)-like permease
MRASGAGLGLALLSAATFGTSGTFATSLLDAGWSPAAAVTIRIGVAALILTVPALIQLRGRWALLRRSLPAVAAYGFVAVAGCQLFFFNAVEHLSVGVALLLEYSGTLLVVAWMWLRHGHRPGRLTVMGGALAIGGLVLVLDLTGTQHIDAVGLLWGLAAAAGLAVYFVLSAHTDGASEGNDRSLPPMVMAWAGMVIGALTLGLFGVIGAVPFRSSTQDVHFTGYRTSWLVPVIGLSLVAAAIAYTAGIAAARRLGARVASFVGLSEVLFAILFAWLLLDQQPSALQLVGGLVVLLGIALVRAGEQDPIAEPGAVEVNVPVATAP